MNFLMRDRIRYAACVLAGLGAFAPALVAGPPDAPAKRSPIMASLQAELDRSFTALKAQDPPAYFVGYTVTETQRANVSGSNGALLTARTAAIVGWKFRCARAVTTLDDTHKVGERQQANGGPGTAVPVDDDTEVLRRAVWLETNKQYEASSQALIKIKTGKEVKVETAEGTAPDFSHEDPHTDIGERGVHPRGSHAMGSESAGLYQGVSRFDGGDQFDCDV